MARGRRTCRNLGRVGDELGDPLLVRVICNLWAEPRHLAEVPQQADGLLGQHLIRKLAVDVDEVDELQQVAPKGREDLRRHLRDF